MSGDGTPGGTPEADGPSAAARPGAALLVGREHELDELTAALDVAATGRGRLFLLEGDPGMGKTTLATALTEHARTLGISVLWGRCWEDGGAPAYWPWAQVLRRYLRERDLAEIRPAAIPVVQRIAAVIPEVAPSVPDAGDPVTAEHDRFALFDAVSTLLQHASAIEPLVLVFDDLHTADHDSLRMLNFLARDLQELKVMIVGTYRGADARRTGAVELLAALGREGNEIPLRGLTEEHVHALVEHVAGTSPRPDVSKAMRHATGGNPYFVDAITRLLVAERRLDSIGTPTSGRSPTGVELPLPPNIRDVIQRRLAYLDDDTRRLLRIASVCGRVFTVATLGTITDQPAPALLEQLQTPVDVGIVLPSSSTPGRYTFEHMLVRDALYGELGPAERAELHARTGTALERAHAGAIEPHLEEIAHHHLLAATPDGDIVRAVEYATRAGRRAMAQAAYEQAATLFERALVTLNGAALDDRPDDARRCDLLVDLGAARTRHGDTASGRSLFRQAAELAAELHLPDRFADAALGYAGMTGYHFSGRVDETLVTLLERAADLLPPGDSATRVRLLARLGVGLYWSPLTDRRHELSEEAVAMARRLDDPGTLAMALHSRRYAQWSPDNFEARLADATRSLQLALEANDIELAASVRRWRITDLLEGGDTTAVDHEIDAHDTLAQQLQQPFLRSLTARFRALRAIMRGDFADGEELAGQVRAHGERAGDARADEVFGMQMLPAWRQRQEDGQLAALQRTILDTVPPHPAATSVVALIHVEFGDHDQAATLVEQVIGDGLKHIRHDLMFVSGLAFLTLALDGLGDTGHSESVYDALRPYTGRVVVSGAPAQACWGAVDHYLGLLAASNGLDEQAAMHFEAALQIGSRLGSSPLLAETRCEYGRLLRRTSGADHDRAASFLAAAHHTATALGMDRLADRVEAETDEVPRRRPPVEPSAVTSDPPSPSPVLSLRRSGDYWVVETAGGSTHLRDMKGIQYLATLLSAPGRRHHVLELSATPDAGGEGSTIPRVRAGELNEAAMGYGAGYGDAGELLDETAKDAYRRRVDELDGQIAEAEEFNDLERASRLRTERDMILQQLAEAVGLGGRDRRAASASERARVNVTRAIRTAIRHIAEHDPAAGRVLDDTVLTGTYCIFEPWRTEHP